MSSNHSAIRSGVNSILLDFASFLGVVVLERSSSPRSILRRARPCSCDLDSFFFFFFFILSLFDCPSSFLATLCPCVVLPFSCEVPPPIDTSSGLAERTAFGPKRGLLQKSSILPACAAALRLGCHRRCSARRHCDRPLTRAARSLHRSFLRHRHHRHCHRHRSRLPSTLTSRRGWMPRAARALPCGTTSTW